MDMSPAQTTKSPAPVLAIRWPMLSGVLVVSAVAFIGVLLAFQGWRTHDIAVDMLTYIENGDRLLRSGTLPRFGDVSSYGSFSPPGTTWLLVPGMLLFDDPRLFESVGSSVLFFGTLFGLFLLARAAFGVWCAYVSVALFGLSAIGLSFAGSLWPIGHPFFYVWLVILSGLWIIRGQAWFLAAGLVTWAVGTNIDLAIAPVLFILPVLWLLYRPPVRITPVLLSVLVALGIWAPYLHFQTQRDFVDLRSQLLRQTIIPNDVQATWCDPTLTLQHWQAEGDEPTTGPAGVIEQANRPGIAQRIRNRFDTALTGMHTNFTTSASQPVAGWLLLGATLLTLAATLWMTLPALLRTRLGRFKNSAPVNTATGSLSTDPTNIERWRWRGIVGISLAVPWFLLLIAAEPGRTERFVWLWPLQVLFLAAFITVVLLRLARRPVIVWLGIVAVAVVVLGNVLEPPVRAWTGDGWSGEESAEVRTVDYLAEQIQDDGEQGIAIGYQTFVYPFIPNYNAINPTYKVGAEFDALLKYRHDIENTGECAEGVSENDRYRIIQTQPKSHAGAPTDRFDLPTDQRFELEREIGIYQVYTRR